MGGLTLALRTLETLSVGSTCQLVCSRSLSPREAWIWGDGVCEGRAQLDTLIVVNIGMPVRRAREIDQAAACSAQRALRTLSRKPVEVSLPHRATQKRVSERPSRTSSRSRVGDMDGSCGIGLEVGVHQAPSKGIACGFTGGRGQRGDQSRGNQGGWADRLVGTTH